MRARGSRPDSRRVIPSPFAWRQARAVLLGAALLLVGAGCISEEREIEIGDDIASQVNPHLPIIDDPLLNAYVHAVGDRLVAVSERPELDFRFYIVDSDLVNAFALPGGHVYLTRGLIDRTRDGDEFAGVLAHEIGHVAARHGVKKLQRHLRTGSLVNVLYNMILGGEPELLRDNSLRLANEVWSARHSRNDEQEADRLAVRYLLRTGVDPRGVVTLLESLLEDEEEEERDSTPTGQRLETLFSTHPLTQSRIEDARNDILRYEGREEQLTELDLDAFDSFQHLVTSFSPMPANDWYLEGY